MRNNTEECIYHEILVQQSARKTPFDSLKNKLENNIKKVLEYEVL